MEQYNIQQEKTTQDNTVINSGDNNQSYRFSSPPLPTNGFDTNHSSDPFHSFSSPPTNNPTITMHNPQVIPNTYPNKENTQIQMPSSSQSPAQPQYQTNAQVQASFQSAPQNTMHSSNVLSPNPPQSTMHSSNIVPPNPPQNTIHSSNIISPNPPQNNYVPPIQYNSSYSALHNSGGQPSAQPPTSLNTAINDPPISAPSYSSTSSANQSTTTGTETTTKPATKKTDSESLKNQKFIILALLSSIVITVLIIGLGAALLAPKNTTNNLTQSTQENGAPQINNQTNGAGVSTNGTATDNDLQIIYGTENTDLDPKEVQNEVPKKELIAKQDEPATVVKKVTVAPVIDSKKTSLSASNIANTNASTIPAKPTVATSPTSTQYWIQIFSTPNRDKINQIKKELMSQGLTSTIVPKTIDQTLYYRLRIGPYYNKDEGNKFLAWIRKNDNYRDAYISIAKHTNNG